MDALVRRESACNRLVNRRSLVRVQSVALGHSKPCSLRCFRRLRDTRRLRADGTTSRSTRHNIRYREIRRFSSVRWAKRVVPSFRALVSLGRSPTPTAKKRGLDEWSKLETSAYSPETLMTTLLTCAVSSESSLSLNTRFATWVASSLPTSAVSSAENSAGTVLSMRPFPTTSSFT